MTLKDAIKRLGYTISNQNKPNQTDAEAINEIIRFTNNAFSNSVNDNLLFAKLLAIDLKRRYLICNQDINETLKSLSRDLKNPLEFHIDTLSNKMISTQIINYVKTLKIDVPESEFNDPIALAKRENQFWDEHEKNILNEILFMNSKEQIKDKFYMTANEILNNDKYKE